MSPSPGQSTRTVPGGGTGGAAAVGGGGGGRFGGGPEGSIEIGVSGGVGASCWLEHRQASDVGAATTGQSKAKALVISMGACSCQLQPAGGHFHGTLRQALFSTQANRWS